MEAWKIRLDRTRKRPTATSNLSGKRSVFDKRCILHPNPQFVNKYTSDMHLSAEPSLCPPHLVPRLRNHWQFPDRTCRQPMKKAAVLTTNRLSFKFEPPSHSPPPQVNHSSNPHPEIAELLPRPNAGPPSYATRRTPSAQILKPANARKIRLASLRPIAS